MNLLRLLLTRVKLTGINNAKLRFHPPNIYYIKNRKKINVHKLNIQDVKYPFLKIEDTLKSEKETDWYDIFVSIDLEKFNSLKENLDNRFYDLLNKCYWETGLKYHGSLLKKMYVGSKQDTNLYMYPNSIVKVGSTYVNTRTRVLLKNCDKISLTLKGHMIYDSTGYNWISDVLCKISRKSLIIIDKANHSLWKEKLNDKKMAIVMTAKKYQNIISNTGDIDYLVIANNVITKEINKVNWNHLIVDAPTFDKIMNNPSFEEIISNIESSKRWGHMDSDITDTKYYVSYLSNKKYGDITYPLYSDDKFHYPLLIEESKFKNAVNINTSTVLISESIALKIGVDSIVDLLSLSRIDKESIIGKVNNTDKYLSNINFNNNSCTICYDKLNDIVITTCGHIYCAECIVKCIIQNGNSCPMCKSELNISDLIMMKHDEFPNKYQQIVNDLTDEKTVIYLNHSETIFNHVEGLLKERGINYINLRNAKTWNNKNSNWTCVLISKSEHAVSKLIPGIKRVIWTVGGKIDPHHEYLGKDYLTNAVKNISLIYYTYQRVC